MRVMKSDKKVGDVGRREWQHAYFCEIYSTGSPDCTHP